MKGRGRGRALEEPAPSVALDPPVTLPGDLSEGPLFSSLFLI